MGIGETYEDFKKYIENHVVRCEECNQHYQSATENTGWVDAMYKLDLKKIPVN